MKPNLACLPVAALALLAAAGAARAQDGAEPAKTETEVLARLKAIDKEFDSAQQAFFELYQKAATDEEKQQLLAEKNPKPERWSGEVTQLADSVPRTDAAFECLQWLISHQQEPAAQDQALAVVLRDHVQREDIGALCDNLLYSQSQTATAVLDAVLEKNEHRAARGKACYARARRLSREAELVRTVQGLDADSERLKQFAGFYGAERIAALQGGDAAAIGAQAEKGLERCVEEFGDVGMRRGTLGETAQRDLFEIRNLAIGKTAPDIEGADQDEVAFKLSEYRGKVVVLDFWGDW